MPKNRSNRTRATSTEIPAAHRTLDIQEDDQECFAMCTVSLQHLRVLENASWIQGLVDGPATPECLDPARVARLRKVIEEIP